MPRSVYRCQNPQCHHILGWVRPNGSLKLAPGAGIDETGAIACPACGAVRSWAERREAA